MQNKRLIVNGIPGTLVVDPGDTLAQVLRRQLGLTGVKIGCGTAMCGACSVIMNGKVVRSCVVKMKKIEDNANITTIEGIGTPYNLHPLQLSWTVHGGAQCGFCSPGFIVSAKALLDKNGQPSRQDVRDWFQKHRNACRCTGYQPLVDAVMDAARVLRGEITMQDLAYKMPADGRVLGTRHPRPSAVSKVTGTCDFGADLGLKLPRSTLSLVLVQARVSHANIRSIDTSEAAKMPGVYRILTHKDVKGTNRISGLITFPTNKGDGNERPILCDEKVFQFGDAMAIVCADTEEDARAAAKKVKVDLEVLPACMSAPAAMAPDAIEIHPGTPNVYFEIPIIKGEDTKPIMEKAAHVVQDDFYVGRQPHLPIEPDCGFAYCDDEGRLTIHSKSVAVHLHAAMIAGGIGVDITKLRLITNPAGGNFGYKMSPTCEALLAVACMATGRPVFLNYDYYQQITYTGKRSPFFINLKYAADRDGKILAMESEWNVDHGPYSEFGDLLTMRGAQSIGAGYGIPNIRGIGRTVCTNHAWGSAFRAYGSPQSEFASEVLMDELAEKIGVDPLELRYKNVYRPGDTTPVGCEPDVYCLPSLLDMMRPFYKAARRKARRRSTPGKSRGVGISVGVYGCGLDGPDTSEAAVVLTPDGVTLLAAWGEHGQGADMGCLATVHESLRPLAIPPEKITLVMNDSIYTPNSGPAAGSRSQVMVGNAIKNAAGKLIEAMKKPDGSYRTYGEMVTENIPLRHNGVWTAASCTPCSLETAQGNPYPTYMYVVFMSEVEVDLRTGRTKVLKMTACCDVGTIVNRLVIDGQFYGGLVQGVGLALTEDFEDLKKDVTIAACGIPYAGDAPPEMELHYLETPRSLGPFGASGAGEVPLTSPHASIINAIHDACGVRITRLPALPEKVLAGLKAKG